MEQNFKNIIKKRNNERLGGGGGSGGLGLRLGFRVRVTDNLELLLVCKKR